MHELFETDILFGIASHVFVNMIYLLPGSCVVAVSPCLLSSSHLNSIAEQSQLLFLEVSNFSIPIPPACNDRMSDVVGHIEGIESARSLCATRYAYVLFTSCQDIYNGSQVL